MKNYIALLGIRSGRSRLVEGVLNASIGPVTSETLRQCQLSVDVQAAESTIPGLIEAIVRRARATSTSAHSLSGSFEGLEAIHSRGSNPYPARLTRSAYLCRTFTTLGATANRQ